MPPGVQHERPPERSRWLALPLSRLLVAAFAVSFVLGLGWGKAAGVPWRGGDAGADAGAGRAAATSAPPTTGGTTSAPPSVEEITTTITELATTTLPKGGRVPTPAEPLRIAMAGDSVMAGLAPAVEAALESGGAADVRFVLTPTIIRDATVRFTWEQQLEKFDPELIVMFIGTWESRQVLTASGEEIGMGDARWRNIYETEVVDPWIRLITSQGARVLWIGSPAAVNPEANLVFAGLNAVFHDIPNRFDTVEYLDASGVLQGPSSGFNPVIPRADGRLVRTRQVDGLHLCSDGAILLGQAVVDLVVADWGVPVGAGWDIEGATWRSDPALYPITSCPTVG